MVTCVPGHSDCTASASTWAASCRISSSARGSSRLMNSIFASASIGSARSRKSPSSAIATVRLASDGEMPLAISRPVMLLGNSRLAPSGKVRAMRGSGSTGFRLATLYWNPDAGAFLSSGMVVSCCSLLRTSAGKRERGGLLARGCGKGNGVLRVSEGRQGNYLVDPLTPARAKPIEQRAAADILGVVEPQEGRMAARHQLIDDVRHDRHPVKAVREDNDGGA